MTAIYLIGAFVIGGLLFVNRSKLLNNILMGLLLHCNGDIPFTVFTTQTIELNTLPWILWVYCFC
jgi:membrane protein CcdC involved in cytochrome C biogenesis